MLPWAEVKYALLLIYNKYIYEFIITLQHLEVTKSNNYVHNTKYSGNKMLLYCNEIRFCEFVEQIARLARTYIGGAHVYGPRRALTALNMCAITARQCLPYAPKASSRQHADIRPKSSDEEVYSRNVWTEYERPHNGQRKEGRPHFGRKRMELAILYALR